MLIFEVEQFGDYAPIYLFTYGMLTDPKYMPNSDFVGVATLPNHRFEFYHWADVNPQPGSSVSGVLWRIPMSHIPWLDQNEDVAGGLYTRKTKPVQCDGQRYEALVYQMTPRTRQQIQDRMPSRKYLTTLARGYLEYGVDAGQIKSALAEVLRTQP